MHLQYALQPVSLTLPACATDAQDYDCRPPSLVDSLHATVLTHLQGNFDFQEAKSIIEGIVERLDKARGK